MSSSTAPASPDEDELTTIEPQPLASDNAEQQQRPGSAEAWARTAELMARLDERRESEAALTLELERVRAELHEARTPGRPQPLCNGLWDREAPGSPPQTPTSLRRAAAQPTTPGTGLTTPGKTPVRTPMR